MIIFIIICLVWYMLGFIPLFYYVWYNGEVITIKDLMCILIYSCIGPMMGIFIVYTILGEIGFLEKPVLNGKDFKKIP